MKFYKKNAAGEWQEVNKSQLKTGDEYKKVKPTKYGDLIIEGAYSEPHADDTSV